MAQIRVNHLTFSYEGSFDNIFEDVSFSIDTGWKLGFLGRNGKGKTTFLNLLMGKEAYAGSICAPGAFDCFPYALTEEQMQRPAAEFADQIKPQSEQWRILREMERMQENVELLYRPFHTLSPGERTKILLAILFSGEEQDFLLIDEPTNHLDWAARDKVRQYLSSKKSFLLVSHDRDLLDACVDHVLVLNRKTIEVQSGNFSSWWENKRRKDQFAKAENEKHRKEIEALKRAAAQTVRWADKNEATKIGYHPIKEDRFIGTRAYIGAKTKKMQSRAKQIEKRMHRQIEEKEGLLVDLEEMADLKLMPLSHPKKVLVNVKDYSVTYPGAKQPAFAGLTCSVSQGERIALHGGNGCGKSTLLKMILQHAGVEQEQMTVSESGICETASGLIISYVSQDTSALHGGISDFCAKRNLEEGLYCAVLRQLAVEREQFGKDLSAFSEGQKKKALLAASLLTPAHLYIWDEPLNYIDVFSRMQLEALLRSVCLTLLFVEHDARFRKAVATGEIALQRKEIGLRRQMW